MEPHRTSARDARVAGGLAGLLAGAAGLAVAGAVSAVLTGTTSPLLAVANRAVDSAPRPVKEWAVETFGTADKPVLIGGVVVTVAALAFLAGAVGVTRRRTALVLLAVLSAVAASAVLTDRAADAPSAVRLLPVAALVVVSTAALLLMLRTLRTVPSYLAGGSAP
ncbi:MAG TPA: hypothetical protein VFR87_20230, partial [Nocardioidaceae bacterium]|nr:hypothetical protein [Nocardioidaceae bacterium]